MMWLPTRIAARKYGVTDDRILRWIHNGNITRMMVPGRGGGGGDGRAGGSRKFVVADDEVALCVQCLDKRSYNERLLPDRMFNCAAHEQWSRSGGEYGWPPDEKHPSPTRLCPGRHIMGADPLLDPLEFTE